MNSIQRLGALFGKKIAPVLLCSSLLFSCGDPITTQAGISGTGIVVGIITGFGSVFVNGVEFETDNSSFDVDDNPLATQDDLEIGMVVTINGNIDDNGLTGTATSIVFDDEIEGPIDSEPVVVPGSDNSQKTLSVLGYTITIDQLNTVYKDTTFDTLAVNDIVEISGFRTASNQVSATLVKKTDDFRPGESEVELKATISEFSAVDSSFKLINTTVNFDSTTEIEGDVLLENGLFVEVKGVLESANIITASKIEIEDEDNEFDENSGDISLQGIISDFNSLSDFKINGQTIDASNASLEPVDAASQLENGIRVEVEGSIVNGVLQADELEISGGEIELKTTLSSVNLATKEILLTYPMSSTSVTVATDNSTQLNDETEAEIEPLTLADLFPGDFLDIEARELNGKIIATQIKRNEIDERVLQGEVDSFLPEFSITILGVSYSVDSSTEYEDSDGNTLLPADFFNQLKTGDLVKIKDKITANGIADKISLKD